MSRRNLVSDVIQQQIAAANPEGAPRGSTPEARVTSGAVRNMGLSLERMTLERKSLEDALALGGGIVELPTDLVEGSFAADRFGPGAGETTEQDPALSALIASIATHGQEVPILVRPLPDRPGHYQAAYGHRRLAACRALGCKVRAIIRPLTDSELVVAQGLENAARVDLSFIEKASFARTLERQGFDRSTIMAALATDKTELSKMLSAVAQVPEAMARIIGPAPRAGRRRWLQLGAALAEPKGLQRAEVLLADPAFRALDTDRRFVAVLAAAQASPADRAEAAAHRMVLKSPDGAPLARVEETGERLTLAIDRRSHRAFADYLVRSVPELYERYLAEEGQPSRRGR